MRVALLAASGRTGRATASELSSRGHQVTGVVRQPERARGADLDRVVEADAHDRVALARAFADQHDAVVSCVGPVRGESPTVMRDTIRPTLGAMVDVGLRRLVVVTASGWVVDGDDPLSRFVAKPILARVLRQANADFAATEDIIRASELDWTIVRPPRLLDGPARGTYHARRDGNVRWRYSLRRADLAMALADALEDPSAGGQVISVAN
jgi:putative NADH-flavin reductase